jgi:MFS family permease
VLILCTAFKSINMIGLLACPAEPTIAFWVLAPVFMIDAFLNAGIAIANNGFMIKNSPRESRTMFVAAGTGFAGIVGGAASILAGATIAATADWSWSWSGTQYVNFHVLFAVSLVLRLVSAALATRIREPSSTGTREVAGKLLLVARLRVRSVQSVFVHRSTRQPEPPHVLPGPRRPHPAPRRRAA